MRPLTKKVVLCYHNASVQHWHLLGTHILDGEFWTNVNELIGVGTDLERFLSMPCEISRTLWGCPKTSMRNGEGCTRPQSYLRTDSHKATNHPFRLQDTSCRPRARISPQTKERRARLLRGKETVLHCCSSLTIRFHDSPSPLRPIGP